MIPDNYTIAGVTAVMYNVELNLFFDGASPFGSEVPLREDMSGLSDVGFRYRKTSSQNYTRFSVVSGGTITDSGAIYSEGTVGSVMFQRYRPKYGNVYPCRVLVSGLEPQTSYEIESYYVVGGVERRFNRTTFTTLVQNDSACDDIVWGTVNPVPEEERPAVMDRYSSGIGEMVRVYNMFCPIGWHFTATLVWIPGAGWAADSGMYFNAATSQYDNIRSISTHEAAHNFLLQNVSDNENMRFMEFATGVSDSKWYWLAAHNYPVISSARYSFMDDCLVAAACWLSQRNA